MNCEQVIPLLSAYHDGELPNDQREAVTDHLVDCSHCQMELASFESLSGLVRHSPAPEPPAAMIHNVERALKRDARKSLRWSFPARWLSLPVAVAATLIFAVAIWKVWPGSHGTHDHGQMVESFNRFLDNYLAGDELATAILPEQFHGKPVDLGGATEFLKRPSVAKSTLLKKHQVKERMALKMPCCDCVQTSYTCDGKNSLVVFEHTEEQKDWYGRRPQIHTECAGKSCCLVELGTNLIATWPNEQGYVTVVGAKDVTEVAALVAELTPSQQ
jgi:hypothetical protein